MQSPSQAQNVSGTQPVVPVVQTVASTGARLTAIVLDGVVLVVPLMLLSFVPVVRGWIESDSGLFDGVAWSVYYAVMLAVRGRTVGMAAVGLRVVPLAQFTGRAPDGLTVRQACVRTLVFLLPVLPWAGVRFAWAVVDCLFVLGAGSYRQALHDRIAGTVVVHEGDY